MEYDKTREHETMQIFMYTYMYIYIEIISILNYTPLLLALFMLIIII